MRASLHDLWGCARGPITRLAPQTRLAAGFMVFTAAMVAPATAPGCLSIAAMLASWLTACRPPLRVVGVTVALGLILFLPYFLLLPLLPDSPSAVIVPSTVLLRGISGMLISIAAVSSLSPSDLREALIRLPVPRLVSAILLQIVQQTATLFYETKQVAAAIAVRGASSGGLTAWRLLSSLPRVWLPRVIVRAERVAAAIELRGYCDGDLQSFRRARTRLVDWTVLILAAFVLALSIALRVWSAR